MIAAGGRAGLNEYGDRAGTLRVERDEHGDKAPWLQHGRACYVAAAFLCSFHVARPDSARHKKICAFAVAGH